MTTQFTLRDEHGEKLEIEADDLDDAREQARDWVLGGDWNADDETFFVSVRILDEDGDSVDRIVIAIDPSAPRCGSGEKHNWTAPHEIVGGLEENPGVFGSGGGVKIHEACSHCGTLRVTDTWGSDRSTGEQGVETVSYEAGKYRAEVRALAEACDE